MWTRGVEIFSIDQRPGWLTLTIKTDVSSFNQRSLASRTNNLHNLPVPYRRGQGTTGYWRFQTSKELDLSKFKPGDVVDIYSRRHNHPDGVFLAPSVVLLSE